MVPRVGLLVIIVVLAFSSAARAQDSERPRERGVCRDDARKLCTGTDRSSGRAAVLDCLSGQKDKLSDSCRKSLEARGR